MTNNDKITRKMLSLIRESKTIIDENNNDGFPLTKNDAQFGDVRTSQEETFIKTVGENVKFDENSLKYYPKDNNLKFAGEITPLGMSFEFNYNETDGCYISLNSIQLTEANYKIIGKIRDAFVNWKKTLLESGDLMDRLHKISTNQ